MGALFALIFLPLGSPPVLYAVLFAMLIFSALGFPIPEEVTLLLGGYLSYLQFTAYWTTIYVLLGGILLGDILAYVLGQECGDWLWKNIFGRSRFANALLAKARGYFEKHGERVVIFSRPLAGIRIVVPMLAGYFHMNFAKFLLYDITAAVPWTILLVTVSYYLGSGLDFFVVVHEVKHIIYVGIFVTVSAFVLVKLIQRYLANTV